MEFKRNFELRLRYNVMSQFLGSLKTSGEVLVMTENKVPAF